MTDHLPGHVRAFTNSKSSSVVFCHACPTNNANHVLGLDGLGKRMSSRRLSTNKMARVKLSDHSWTHGNKTTGLTVKTQELASAVILIVIRPRNEIKKDSGNH